MYVSFTKHAQAKYTFSRKKTDVKDKLNEHQIRIELEIRVDLLQIVLHYVNQYRRIRSGSRVIDVQYTISGTLFTNSTIHCSLSTVQALI